MDIAPSSVFLMIYLADWNKNPKFAQNNREKCCVDTLFYTILCFL